MMQMENSWAEMSAGRKLLVVQINQNAKTIRNEICKSIKATEELNININKSSNKIEKLKKEANKVLK